MENLKYVSKVVEVSLQDKVWRAIKFVSPKCVVRATRTRNSRNIEVTLSIGKPNWAERELIKEFKKAKEPFPVKNIIVKLIPKKK